MSIESVNEIGNGIEGLKYEYYYIVENYSYSVYLETDKMYGHDLNEIKGVFWDACSDTNRGNLFLVNNDLVFVPSKILSESIIKLVVNELTY